MTIVDKLKQQYGIDMVVRSSSQDAHFFTQSVTMCIGLIAPVNQWITPLGTPITIRWVDTTYNVTIARMTNPDTVDACEDETAYRLNQLFCRINPAYRAHLQSEDIARKWYGAFRYLATLYANFNVMYERVGSLIQWGDKGGAIDLLDKIIAEDQAMFDSVIGEPPENRPLVLTYMLNPILNREEAEGYTIPIRK